jgi:simple sugar transport system permease protein
MAGEAPGAIRGEGAGLEGGEPETSRPSGASRVASSFLRLRWASILLVAIALGAYFAFANDNFLTRPNLLTIAQFLAATAIISAGEVALIICGEIDLSVGQVFALAPFIMFFAADAGAPIALCVVAALVVSAAVGALNGLITVLLRVPSFVTTLGTLFLLNGLTLTISHAFPVRTPEQGTRFAELMGHNTYAELAWALGVIVVVQVALSYTRWGLYTFAVGGNVVGASEAGVNVNLVKISNFMLCSFLGGLAGILEAFRITSIQPLAGGTGIMFQAVAAAVIGGTALAGGSGTIVGGLLGALVLSILLDGFTLVGINADTFDMILGIAILVAMALNVFLGRSRRRGAA